MRRTFLLSAAILAIALIARPAVMRGAPPQTPDAVSRLVSRLAAALASGISADTGALTASDVPTEDAEALAALADLKPDRVTARERDRKTLPAGVRVVVEALVEKSHRGIVTSWQIGARARADNSGEYEITTFEQMDAMGGLFRLALDRSQEFRVHDLTCTGPDLAVTIRSGVAFLVSADDGVAGVIVRGDGELAFHPPGEAEQGQLIVLAQHPALSLSLDAAFIRINPAEFASRFADGLTPMGVVAQDADRAATMFETLAPRAYHVGLGDLSADAWSVLPPQGDVTIEMNTRKFGWLTYTRAAGDAEDVSLIDRQRHHNISMYTSGNPPQPHAADWSEDDHRIYDVLHTDVSVHIAPDRQWVDGRASLHIQVLAASTNTLAVRLDDALAVSSVTSTDLGRLLFFRVLGQNSIVISLPDEVAKDEMVTLTIAYAGRLPARPPGREAMTVTPDRQTPADTRFLPESALVYSGDVAWYPQAPTTDFSTATIAIGVPPGFDVVATGSPVSDVGSDAASNDASASHERIRRFEATRPARYLSCVVTHLLPVSRIDVPVPSISTPGRSAAPEAAAVVHVTSLAHPRQTSRAGSLATASAAIITFFATLIGEAPYPNFTLVSIDADLPGGHSPAYFTLLNEPLSTSPYSWASDPVAFDESPHFLLAHEIAHQWWGQAVGMKNYHDEWLSEGLAQYSALAATANERGPEARRDILRRMRASVTPYTDAGPISLGYRVGHLQDDTRAFRAVVYNKSAIVLDMLRRFLGDEAFNNGLKRFYQESRFQKAGTSDLRAAFEAESHQSLARFFDQWIYGATLPRLRVRASLSPAGDAVLVHVEQLGEVFDLPVSFRAEHQDGSVEELSVVVTGAVTDVRAPLSSPAKRVTVDSDLTLSR